MVSPCCEPTCPDWLLDCNRGVHHIQHLLLSHNRVMVGVTVALGVVVMETVGRKELDRRRVT